MNAATMEPGNTGHAMSMAERATNWLVLAIFAYRALMMPTALASAYSIIGDAAEALVPAVVIGMAANALLAVGGTTGRLNRVLRSRAFMVADPTFAVVLSIWTAVVLPAHTVLLPGRDGFLMYIMGTVVLWTCLRGLLWTGVTFLVAGVALQFVTALLNDAPITVVGGVQILGRLGWLVAGIVVLFVIRSMAQRGGRLAEAEWLRAGRAEERVRALRDLHDTVLQTLAQIVQRCEDGCISRTDRLAEVGQLAEAEANALSEALKEDEVLRVAGFRDRLRGLAEEFTAKGLIVDLDVARLSVEFAPPVMTELTGAVREALTNVLRHAGTTAVEVSAEDHDSGAVVVVRDHGRGFDPVAVNGFGLTESIARRVRELGGNVRVRSAAGVGTTVRLFMGNASRGSRARSASPHRPQTSDELANRALGWFAIPALAYRVCLSPLQIILAVANVGLDIPRSFLIACLLVLTIDLVVLFGVIAGRFRRLLRSMIVFVVDIATAAGLNLWTAVVLPPDTILLPGHQILWGYAVGVIALWTGIRNKWLGVGMVVGGGALQVAMVWLNRAEPTYSGVLQAGAQWSLLVAALITAWMIMSLATTGARAAAKEGVRAGRAVERASLLREVHLGALQTLTSIANRVKDPPASDDMLPRVLRGQALRQIHELRRALTRITPERHGDLVGALQPIVDEFRGEGLRVEFVILDLTADLEPALTKVLAEVVREALANVLRHAGTTTVVIRAQDLGEGVEVVVRDHGRGFDPASIDGFRLTGPIAQRVRELGGEVEVRSTPGTGTRVRVVSHG